MQEAGSEQRRYSVPALHFDYDLAAIGFRCCPSSGGFIGGAADAARHPTDKLAWPGTTATGVRAAIIFMINKIKMIDYYNPSI